MTPKKWKNWPKKLLIIGPDPFISQTSQDQRPTAQNWFFILWNLGTRHLFSYLWRIHRLVSSMPFWFHFHLPVLLYNEYLIKPTCWNPADLFIFKSFHQHFKKMSKGVLLKKGLQFLLLYLLLYSEMLFQTITFNHFSFHLSYFSSCK